MMNQPRVFIRALGLVLLLGLGPWLPARSAAMPEQPIVAAAQVLEPTIQRQLDTRLYQYKVFRVDLSAVERRVRSTGRAILQFDHETFDLVLEPNDLRAAGFRRVQTTEHGQVEELQSPVYTFKGRLRQDPDSIVRLLIMPDLMQGYIRTADDWLFIDPLVKFAPETRSADVVLFRETDVRLEALGVCGASELRGYAERLRARLRQSPAQQGSWEVLRRVQVATDADFEYFQIYGSNANAQIQGIINQVDGIYQAELSLRLEISFQNVYTTSTDPYSSFDPSTLLSQFRNHWNANWTTVVRDLAHLFTGRDMNGSVIGIAYVGVVCNDPPYSYGVSQDFSLMTKLVAHEIGHNFDALHDDSFNPPAANCNGSGPIMCSFIQSNGPNTFSNRSRTDISAHVTANGTCLDQVTPPPPPPPPTGCAAETAMRDSPQQIWALDVLRRLRDQVLPQSLRGQQYVELFNQHTVEVTMLLLGDESLRLAMRNTIERLMPAVEGVVAGRAVTLTGADIAQLEQLLIRLKNRSSSTLQQAIESVLRDLHDPRLLARYGVSVVK